MEKLFKSIAPGYRPGRCYQTALRLLALLVLSACAATIKGYAQKRPENKYVIQLPEEWKGKSKLLSKIIYIIDTHVPELETKELCLACDADFKVAFKTGTPRVKQVYFNQYGTTAYTVLYRFFAYMDVSERSGRIIHRVVMCDTSEVHGYKVFRTMWFGGTQSLSSDLLNYLRNRPPADVATPIARSPEQGSAYNERKRAAMAPEQTELWKAVEKIIMKFKFSDE